MCDKEPIHLGGTIQSIGFLIVVSPEWLIERASANAPRFLGLALDAIVGAPLPSLLRADAVHAIRNRLSMVLGVSSVERAFGVQLQDNGPLFDLALHFAGASIVLEAEPSEAAGSLNAGLLVRSMVERLQLPQSLADFTREAARQVRALTAFDRVMVYRFHPDGTGEVIAESRATRVASFKGLRFPASDIPVQARALYVKNLLRLIVDVDAPAIPIKPALDASGTPIDLTMSVLRAVSPIHLKYLRNMGVAASMSVSIVRDGRLWGLIACHHMEARHVGFERRTTLELFVQMFSLLLERRERAENAGHADRARILHAELLDTISNKASNAENIAALTERFGELITHDGIGIWTEGRAILTGSAPTLAEFGALIDTLNTRPANRVFATVDIGAMHHGGRDFAERASGLLAIPISRTPRDYLVFFRREIAATVVWAGDPRKPTVMTEGHVTLTPRASFDAWREAVRGRCGAWTEGELGAAEQIRIALLEVVLRHVDSSVDEQRDVAAQQELLIAELNHRVRNILGLVKGLVSQSGTTGQNVGAFSEILGARVQSLARAHDQITARRWDAAPLRRLIATEAEPYRDRRADCVAVTGPEILLNPRAFTTVALLIHELMTNSAKYGAVGSASGVTAIEWHVDDGGDCVLTWRERGGPAVIPPTQRGFGSMIIERSVAHDLGGEGRIDYEPGGVHARFVIPAAHVSVGTAEADVNHEAPVAPSATSLDGAVLLVEDNMIIALDAEAILLSLGASRVDIAGNNAEAMRHIDHEAPSLALLDVNISDGTSYAIAARLTALGVPLIFATGYGADFTRPPGCVNAPVVAKPYTATAIARAVRAVSTRDIQQLLV